MTAQEQTEQKAEKTSNGKAAVPSGAAVARSEVKPRAKKVKFRDLTLTVPAELPAIILFDLTELEATDDGNPMPMFRLLRSVVGADQFTEIRNRVPEGDDGTAVSDLLSDILEKYGVSLGESEASPDS